MGRPKTSKKFKCGKGMCQSSFDTEDGLRRHRRKVHGGKVSCTICKKVFLNNNALATHSTVHKRSNKEYLLQCQDQVSIVLRSRPSRLVTDDSRIKQAYAGLVAINAEHSIDYGNYVIRQHSDLPATAAGYEELRIGDVQGSHPTVDRAAGNYRFRRDPLLPNFDNQGTELEYEDSERVMAHVVSCGFYTKRKADFAMTFSMTNCVPLTPSNNGGPVRAMEDETKACVQSFGRVLPITLCIYPEREQDIKRLSDGSPIPSYVGKILTMRDRKGLHMIGFKSPRNDEECQDEKTTISNNAAAKRDMFERKRKLPYYDPFLLAKEAGQPLLVDEDCLLTINRKPNPKHCEEKDDKSVCPINELFYRGLEETHYEEINGYDINVVSDGPGATKKPKYCNNLDGFLKPAN